MKNEPASTGLLIALTIGIWAQTAQAIPRFTWFCDLAEASDVVFVGKVAAVSDKEAAIAVTEILDGALDRIELRVSPTQVRSCTGFDQIFKIGESVLIFGTKAGQDRIKVVEDGHGIRPLDPTNPDAVIRFAKRVLEIGRLDEEARHRTMLAEIRSPDALMRMEAHYYITSRMARRDQQDRYKDELVALVRDPDPRVQRTGLQAIQEMRDDDLVPLLVTCSGSEEFEVVRAASMALARHDTPDSAAALIALTRHEDPNVRIRAAVDLGNGSTQPEAIGALTALLDDPNPEVRAMAPRRFVRFFRRGKAGEVIPRLIEMLEDEDPQVSSEAASALGEYRTHETVGPLLKRLEKCTPQDGRMRKMTLDALSCHYSKGGRREAAMIDAQIALVAGILTEPAPEPDHGAPRVAVEILSLSSTDLAEEGLEWAATHHDQEGIRDLAKRCLQQRGRLVNQRLRREAMEAAHLEAVEAKRRAVEEARRTETEAKRRETEKQRATND